MILNSTTLTALRQSFRSLYDGAFDAARPQWDQVAMLVPSSSSENTYGWLGRTTRFREWLGDRVIQNLSEHEHTIKNKSYENTIAVDRDNIDDDNLGVYTPMLQMMGNDAAMHPDELVFNLLLAGFATTCYDGQYFFDTDHPVTDENGVAQSVSNTGGGSGAAWFLMDTSKAIKPLIFQKRKDYNFVALDKETDPNVFSKKELQYGIDARVNVGYALWQLAYGSKQTLDTTNYQAAREALFSMKGDNGRPINVMPNLLVVGPSNEKEALELIQAERLANGATNVYRGTAKVLVCPYLT